MRLKNLEQWLRENQVPIHIYICSALAALALLAYYHTFFFSFHFDDEFYISQNPAIRDLEQWLKIWSYNPARFLTFLSLAFNYHISGESVFGYHLFNFFIHILNGFWVYFLTFFLMHGDSRLDKPNGRNAAFMMAFFCALIFVLHPVQTQAVTYIWQRASSIMAFFSLASLSFYVLARLYSAKHQSLGFLFYGFSFATCFLAMFSKQNAFILPLLIVLTEWIFFSHLGNWKKRVLRLFPFLLTLTIIPWLTYLLETRERVHLENLHEVLLKPYEYFFTQIHVLFTYIRLLILPIHQNLDYDFPFTHNLDWFTVFLGLILLSFIFFAFWCRRKYQFISFGILFFFISLSVESSILPLEDVINEHRLYLPIFGFSMAMAYLWFYILSSRFFAKRSWLIFLIIPFLLAATLQRNKVWEDEESLWLDVTQKSPLKIRGHNNLGLAYLQKGKIVLARQSFQRVLQLDPKDSDAYFNLGVIAMNEKDFDLGLKYYETGLKYEPMNLDARYNLAIIYLNQGEREKALHEFQKIIAKEADHEEVHWQIAKIYMKTDETLRLQETLYQIIKINPDHVKAYFYLALTYDRLKKVEKREEYLQKAFDLGLKLSPESLEKIRAD